MIAVLIAAAVSTPISLFGTHFELAGWPETTVIIRFWLIPAICFASASAIFVADYTRAVG